MNVMPDIYQPLHALVKNLQRLAEQELRKLDLTFIELRVLTLIEGRGSDYTTQEYLASELDIDRSNVGRALMKLEKKLLVERSASEHDRRLDYLSLTGQGKQLGRRIAAVRSVLDATLSSGMTTVEIDHFGALLKKAAAAAASGIP